MSIYFFFARMLISYKMNKELTKEFQTKCFRGKKNKTKKTLHTPNNVKLER